MNSILNVAEIAASMAATALEADPGLLGIHAHLNTTTGKFEPDVHHTFKNFVELFGKGECFVSERNCEQYPYELFTIRNGVKHFALAGEEQIKEYNNERS